MPYSDDDEFGDDFGDEVDLSALEAAPAMMVPDASFKRIREEKDDMTWSKKVKTEVSPTTALAQRVLKERFGLEEFRLKQEQAITRILDGKSSVVVFPTGAGKSLCYQVPAVAFKELDMTSKTDSRAPQFSGVTVVISPLIALMKDQVDALLRRKIKAAVLNSSISRDQYLMTQDDLRNGRLDLVYCAPERLNSEGAMESFKAIPGGIRLLAVDEAHCISEWGHSFRPDYLKIARFAKEANVERVLCLTATATPKVAQDICDAFDIPANEGLFATTVYRPNLRLLAQSSTKEADDVKMLTAYLRKNPGPTIIYVTIQKGAMKLAGELVNRGFPAKPYHAGMPTPLRTKTQEEFIASEDMIVVATIAFGMGIDKPNVRNIIHFDIPSSIESYSQQIGRAGRDGKPSACLFNLSTKDFCLRNIFTHGDRPSKRSLRLLLNDICSEERKHLQAGDTFTVALGQQSKEVDITPTTLGIIYAHLELHFHLFRSAKAQYSKYMYVTKDARAIANDTSSEARAIVTASTKATKWNHVALDALALSSGLDRSNLVRKIDDWNEQGVIEAKKEGVQNLYRLEKPLPTTKVEIDKVINHLDTEMENKELQDLKRAQALITLITDKKCFAKSLAQYFGEGTDKLKDECGHCTWCETHEQVVLPDEPSQAPDPAKVKMVLAACEVRDDPRFLAKLAFGIKSPRIMAEKLHTSPVFESMNVCNFMELVKVFAKHCPNAE